MPLVAFANLPREVANPGAGDIVPRPLELVARDELDEMLAGEGRPEPVGGLASGHDRFVHQVVAEDGWRFGAASSDAAPEMGLGLPALLLVQLVVPLRHVGLVIAAQPGQIEVKADFFSQAKQLGNAVE